MMTQLSSVIFIVIVAVCSYFGMLRKVANAVTLRSPLSTDEVIEKSRAFPLYKVSIWLWCVGTAFAAIASLYTGMEPIAIALAILSQAPFIAARAQFYYKAGRNIG